MLRTYNMKNPFPIVIYDDRYIWNLLRAVFAEFLGTMLFLMCVTTVASGGRSIVEVGIGIGLAIATLAQAFGHVSGGHLNPAVTIGLVFGGRCSVVKGVLYIFAQVVGGIAGTAITYGCTSEDVSDLSNLGATLLASNVKNYQGFGLELMFTFILVFVVFSVTDPKKKVEPYGQTLAIGISIWVCHVCLIPYTNCGINPARSFGPAVIMDKWDDHWLYWVGPCVGGVLAAFCYNVIFYAEEDNTPTREPSQVISNPSQGDAYQMKNPQP